MSFLIEIRGSTHVKRDIRGKFGLTVASKATFPMHLGMRPVSHAKSTLIDADSMEMV